MRLRQRYRTALPPNKRRKEKHSSHTGKGLLYRQNAGQQPFFYSSFREKTSQGVRIPRRDSSGFPCSVTKMIWHFFLFEAFSKMSFAFVAYVFAAQKR